MEKKEIEKIKKDLLAKVDEIFDLLKKYSSQAEDLIAKTKETPAKSKPKK